MIKDSIKILVVEDNANDAKLINYHLKKIISEPDITNVDTFKDFVDALNKFTPDIILSDYKMIGFDGMEVLKHTIENSDVAHFIFITGTIYDEELAAQTILSGATGYILKKNINILHEKLLPYFEKLLVDRKKILPSGYETMLTSVRAFIEDANRDNQDHVANYTLIKDAIQQLKQKKD